MGVVVVELIFSVCFGVIIVGFSFVPNVLKSIFVIRKEVLLNKLKSIAYTCVFGGLCQHKNELKIVIAGGGLVGLFVNCCNPHAFECLHSRRAKVCFGFKQLPVKNKPLEYSRFTEPTSFEEGGVDG